MATDATRERVHEPVVLQWLPRRKDLRRAELWDIYQLAGGAGQRGKNGSGSPSRLGGVPGGSLSMREQRAQSELICSSEPSSDRVGVTMAAVQPSAGGLRVGILPLPPPGWPSARDSTSHYQNFSIYRRMTKIVPIPN